MDVAVLFSGAKDSTFAMYKAMLDGHHVKYLVTMVPGHHDSPVFSHASADIVRLQAEALGIPLITKETSGLEGEEMKDLEEALAQIKPEIQGVVTGLLFNRDKKLKVDEVFRKLGLEHLFISWEPRFDHYLEEIVKSGFHVIMTSVYGHGLNEQWLGRVIDLDAAEELERLEDKYGTHSLGEQGEFNTLVLDCPLFSRRLEITSARKEWNGVKGVYVIESAKLADKKAHNSMR